MKYQPINSDLDLLLPEGTYVGVVGYAKDKENWQKEEVLSICLNILYAGRQYKVWDDLLSMKLKSFCDAASMEEIYKRGEILPGDVTSNAVEVRIGIIPAKGDYKAKNFVKEYTTGKASLLSGDVTSNADAIEKTIEVNKKAVNDPMKFNKDDPFGDAIPF